MRKTYTKLIADDLVVPWDLVDLIVEFSCPSLESTKGMASVLGKCKFPSSAEIPYTFELTPKEHETLQNLLPSLPELHGNMSENEVVAFLKRFHELVEKPHWEPSIVTENSRRRRKEAQAHLRDEHRIALSNAVKSGEVKAVQGNYLPAKNLSIGTFIPREEAQKYLARLGVVGSAPTLVNFDQASGSNASSEHPIARPQQAEGEEKITGNDSIKQAAENKKSPSNGKPWTAERFAEVKEFREKYGTKRAAEHFKISDSLIRQKLPREPKKQSATPMWAQLQKKR